MQAESEARAAEFLGNADEDTKVEGASTDDEGDDSSEDGDLQEIEQTDKVASIESVKYRASSISFPREDGLLCCANNGEPALYDAMNPRRTLKPLFGAALDLWWAAACLRTKRARSASGGSETGQILAWRLQALVRRSRLGDGRRSARMALA